MLMGAANPLSRKQRSSYACKIGSCDPVKSQEYSRQTRGPAVPTSKAADQHRHRRREIRTIASRYFRLFFPVQLEFTQTASKSFLRQHYSLSMHTKLRGSGISPCVGSCRGRAEMSRNDPPWAALKGHLKQWTQTASTSRNWTEISQTRMDRPISSC